MTYAIRDGYTCARCGGFIPSGCVHHCPTTAIHPYHPQPSVPPAIRLTEVGWQCPTCSAGVAPFMPYCPHCAPKTVTTSAGEDTQP